MADEGSPYAAGTWTDIERKLAQPNLDESFDIKSDECVVFASTVIRRDLPVSVCNAL